MATAFHCHEHGNSQAQKAPYSEKVIQQTPVFQDCPLLSEKHKGLVEYFSSFFTHFFTLIPLVTSKEKKKEWNSSI